MDEKFLSFPWQIQVALGSGYAAYMLAYVGIREHHKAVDTTFKSLAFSLIATAVLLASSSWKPFWSIFAAVAWSLAAGFIWRRFGIELLRKALHKTDTSWADDTPSAWAAITVCNSAHPVSQVSVQLDDGTWLQCSNTAAFKAAPFGPVMLGANGDVALYVTDTSINGVQTEVDDVEINYWGKEMTYIPASKIKRVALRYYTGP